MTPQEKLVSNEYFDLLIEYNGDFQVLERFDPTAVNIIDFFHAVVHVPVEEITELSILEYGYAAIPSIFGLVDAGSLEASGVTRLRNVPSFDFRGQGVLIGVVDTGIDYTNPIFRYADNTTKIVSLWDQSIGSEVPEVYTLGTEFTREHINMALQSEDPFLIVPSMDESGHGTMIAGIAAGNVVLERGFSGVAPEAELLIVKLKPAKANLKDFWGIPQNTLCYQENDILFGVNYLLRVAARLNKPIAICFALGSSQGPHDGTDNLSAYVSLQAENSRVAMVIAAGNEGDTKRHYFGIVDPMKGFETVELNVGENEVGFSMELWGRSPGIFSIDILTPSGEYVPRITARLDENREISFIFEQTIIYVDYRMVESQSGDQLILIRFRNPAPGIWKFNVYGRGDLQLAFHIWLPMNGFISLDTYFINSNPYSTILEIGNGTVPITVTAYNYENNSLYLNASRGPTRIGTMKPELTAPGVNILSPTLNQGFTPVTGTSASAAHTTGLCALLLEWGIIRGNLRDMSTIDIKNFLIRGARRDPNLIYPNYEWGYGIVDVFHVFDRLRRGI